MRRIACLGVLLGLLAAPAHAEKRPEPGTIDPHIQSVLYDPQDVVLLEVAQGYQLTVQFASDERIENVAVGDGGTWQVTQNHRGDHIFVKPVRSGGDTDLVVVTDARTYDFTLRQLYAASPTMPFSVRFRYPQPVASETPVTAAATRWRLSGDPALRPDRIEDDGTHISIVWPDSVPLPATFKVDETGTESSVNGTMRGGAFVIDERADKLIFRFGNQSAEARRIPMAKAQ